ncbi:hypothetical protein C8F01DRAFT_1106142, partial [Mycena amicta]
IHIFKLLVLSMDTVGPACYGSCDPPRKSPFDTPFPLNVSHVCCAWRMGALATRELWSSIRLHIHTSFTRGESPDRDALTAAVLSGRLRFDLCGGPSAGGKGAFQLLKLYLGRAVDLDVRILVVAEWAFRPASLPATLVQGATDPGIEDNGEGNDDEDTTLSAFHLLLRRASCWKRCEMPYTALCVLEHLLSSAGPRDDAFPQLSVLTIPDMQSQYADHERPRLSSPLKVFQHAPALRKLSIHAVGPDGIILPWAQLTTVSLIEHRLRDTLSLLRQSPNIIRLKIISNHSSASADDHHPGSFSQAPVTLFRLRAFLLYSPARSLLDSLTLPNMCELDLCSLPDYAQQQSLDRIVERSERCYYATKNSAVEESRSRDDGELPGSIAPTYSGITNLCISMLEERIAGGGAGEALVSVLLCFPQLVSLMVYEGIDRLTQDTLGWFHGGRNLSNGLGVDWNDSDEWTIKTNPWTVLLAGLTPFPGTDTVNFPGYWPLPNLRKLTLEGCTKSIDVRSLQAFIQPRVETATAVLPFELDVEIVYGRQPGSDHNGSGYAEVQEAESIRKLKEILRSDAGSGVKLTADYVPRRWDASLDRQMMNELCE